MKLEEAIRIMDLFVKNIAVENVKVFELKDACKVALQELEHLQKENEMQKFEIDLARKRIEGELEVLEKYSFNNWENHFAFVEEAVAVKKIRNITNGFKDLLKEE